MGNAPFKMTRVLIIDNGILINRSSISFQKVLIMTFFKVFVAILFYASFLFAQENASATQALQKTEDLTIHGKVVSVDVKANTIIVKTKHHQDTLVLESGAKIMLGRMELSKEISLDDIQAGVKVTVTWELINGKKNAVKIVEESAFDAPEQIR